MTIGLIVANVVVFLLEIRAGGSFWSGPTANGTVRWGLIPYEVTHWGKHCDLDQVTQQVVCQGQPGVVGRPSSQPATIVTIFTSMFVHGGILHLGGNMLFLWVFGNNVEDSMGRIRFVIFYFLGGIAASALQIAVNAISAVPSIGASGAIAAVLGGYLVVYPRARVLTLVFLFIFFTFIEIPALFFLVIWFFLQVLYAAADLSHPVGGGGVAYFAHIGGFAFGALTIRLFAKHVKHDYQQPKYPLY